MQQMLKSYKMYLVYVGILLIESTVIGVIFDSFIIAGVFACIMLLYMDVIGESYGRFSMRCELVKENEDAQSYKVIQSFNLVKRKAEILYPSVENINLYYIPTDDINAYTFGRTSVAITSGAMSLDSHIIEAILSHELGHSINAHMFFYRFLFGNLIGIMILVGIWNTVIIGVVVLIGIFIIALTAIRLNFVTYQISNFFINMLQKLLSAMQNLLMSIGQAIIAVVSMRSEYNADTFAHRLGYGNYLCIFLSKYAMNFETFQPRTITEMLYASHPEPIKRINHLKSIEQQ